MMADSQTQENSAGTSQLAGWVMIPARDEEAGIAVLVTELRCVFPRVLVVADNCRDRTAEIARQAGAKVLERQGTGGKGMALREGWLWLAAREDCDFVLLLDGDGQHLAAEAESFMREWQRAPVDLIVGSRAPFLPPMPLLRRSCNRFMSWLVSLKIGRIVQDSQCGYRLLSRRLFSMPDWRAEHFEIETEIILRAAKAGLVIRELLISTRYAQEHSRIAVVRDTLRWLRFMLRG